MTRWDWTWEDRSQTSATPTVEPGGSATQPNARASAGDEERARASTATGGGLNAGGEQHGESPRARGTGADQRARVNLVFRRRRAAAGLVGIVLLGLVLWMLSSHKGASPPLPIPAKRSLAEPRLSAAERAASAAKGEENAISSVLSYTPAVRSGGAHGNEVALTFDDGPGPYTQQLVTALNKLDVHATFFAIGSQEQYFSAGTLAEIGAGDAIGDHTETHPMMASLSAHDQYEELFDQMAQIEVLGGKRPRLFRPPYGSFNATTFRELHHLRLLMILWSVDTADYTLPGVSAIVHTALSGAKPGAIILMHDGGGNRAETIAALPAIVKGLRKRGLRPVTVGQLLLDDPPPRGLPLPTNLSGD